MGTEKRTNWYIAALALGSLLTPLIGADPAAPPPAGGGALVVDRDQAAGAERRAVTPAASQSDSEYVFAVPNATALLRPAPIPKSPPADVSGDKLILRVTDSAGLPKPLLECRLDTAAGQLRIKLLDTGGRYRQLAAGLAVEAYSPADKVVYICRLAEGLQARVPATQPGQPATYLGKPVSGVWVDKQYDFFKGRLFKVKTLAVGRERFKVEGEPASTDEVVNVADSNFDTGGKIIDVCAGETGRGILWVKNEMTVAGGGVKFIVKTYSVRDYSKPGNAMKTETEFGRVDVDTGLMAGQIFKHPFLYGSKMGAVIAEKLTKPEFIDFINGGHALITGFREISPDQAAKNPDGLREKRGGLGKVGRGSGAAPDVSYWVPIAVPAPDAAAGH